MDTQKPSFNQFLSPILWILAILLIMGCLLSKAVYPDKAWLTLVLFIAAIFVLGYLIQQNRLAFKSRAMAFGVFSTITTLLVLGIIGVVNYVSFHYPFKWDLTKNKLYTLSDQTKKLVKELKSPVKAISFSRPAEREPTRQLLENYKSISSKFEIEFIDPDKEPMRVNQIASGKKYKMGFVQLVFGTRDQKIEDPNEEKITNALMKLLKEKPPTFCATTGHGEKNFNSTEQDGYDSIKKGLSQQSYEFSEISLVQEGKIPEKCDSVAIIGSTKGFFPQELKIIKDYLSNGGRLVIALDLNMKGEDFASDLYPILLDWHIKPVKALIVDPLSKIFNLDASVPMIQTYSSENTITRDFGKVHQSFFPLSMPLEIAPNTPTEMTVHWLAQTMPTSWGATDMKELATGKVRKVEGKDKSGPLNIAVAVEGKLKDSKATKKTRLVVFGTSQFANNMFGRNGVNADFFLNSVSWLVEDESVISIRAKEAEQGRVELTQTQATTIFWLVFLIIPFLTASGGIVLWVVRRRM
ncbi:MAG: GldG family protein [Bdellovibrio sp.]|nr:GldG family protein [Bdellovibrio sp.]